MIVISNSQGKELKSIPNQDIYFDHVSAGELLEDHPEFDKKNPKWSFIIFSPKRVPELYFKMKQEHVVSPIKEAFRHELGLIEICKGDYEKPTWITLTADLDVGKLKKEWYLDFCRNHGYIISNLEEDESLQSKVMRNPHIRT